MTGQVINPEPIRNKTTPTIRIEIEPNCWICGKEIKEGELFIGTLLKKNTRHFYHADCWKHPEKHGWMV